LSDFPDFEEKHYVAPTGEEWTQSLSWASKALPLFSYPSLEAGTVGFRPDYPRQPYIVETDRNIPAGTIPLREGAKVFSADDKQVGDVERVLIAAGAERATHLVIGNGLLLKARRVVPVEWVTTVTENEIHLAVGAWTFAS
jgi:hypothetical protein